MASFFFMIPWIRQSDESNFSSNFFIVFKLLKFFGIFNNGLRFHNIIESFFFQFVVSFLWSEISTYKFSTKIAGRPIHFAIVKNNSSIGVRFIILLTIRSCLKLSIILSYPEHFSFPSEHWTNQTGFPKCHKLFHKPR